MPEEPQTEPDGKQGSDAEFLRGTVVRVTFRSEDSGFTVLKVEPDSDNQNFGAQLQTTTVVGEIPSDVGPGVSFIARGTWKSHPKFGKQFRAYSFTEAEPTSDEAIIRYLGSGNIKGFGRVLAERVVRHFGEQTISILDEDPDRLREVSGIGAKKLLEIKSSWGEKKNLREIILFFQQQNVSLGLATRIHQAYGDRAIEKVTENPYILARDVWGVGFRTADRIARSLGIDPNSKERLIAGIAFTLKSSADDGHCYLPTEELVQRAARLLELEDTTALEEALAEANLRSELVEEQGQMYLPSLHLAEQQLCRRIAMRVDPLATPTPPIEAAVVSRACGESYAAHGGNDAKMIRLSEEQQRAIRFAAERQLTVITGGPGCGKTTVLRAIAALFRRAGLNTKLTAPTGRAAQRLAEVCSMEASTIHRLLRYDPSSRGFVHDQQDPLELDALIVDESSMIDLPLATALFNAIPAGTRIVIVGDADQLPSVGPGRFLADLLRISAVPRVELTALFRRAEESLITGIAHKINAGEIPSIPEPDGQTRSDAYLLEAKELETAANLVERVVVEQIPKKFGFTGADITVLTPMNQGDIGVITLNQRLQDRLVPLRPGLPFVRWGNIEFRLGDRVCQRVNNYNIHANGVFNGDQGEIVGIDAESRSVFVQLWDGREIEYPSDTLHQLDLAYALTIHRSQGSEVPAVVLLVHQSHTIMLERQLIYTAVTRAKQLLIVIGTKKALALSAKRNRSTNRFTSLVERTEELLL